MTSWAPRRRTTSVVALALTGLLLAFLAWLLLSPHRLEERHPDGVAAVQKWISSQWGPQFATIDWLDGVANTAVFVAVGILAYLVIPRRAWYLALLVSPALSALVELVQAVALPGRVSDPRDVLAATVGGAIGVGLSALCTALTAQRRHPEGPA